jgi:hypothetical protein
LQYGGTADAVPTERISLAHAKLQVTAKEVAEGKVTSQTTFLYDLATAKG